MTQRAIDFADFDRFLADVDLYVEMQRGFEARTDRWMARRFNVFDYIDPDENLLSMIIADLFDPQGTHGQDDAFLRLFCEVLVGHGGPQHIRAPRNPRITREAPTTQIDKYLRRIDILVEWRDEGEDRAIAIENKPWAFEQPEQVSDYAEHLDGRYGSSVLIYLTPEGVEPESARGGLPKSCRNVDLVCMSYRAGITRWLDQCARASDADRVRAFLRDFQTYVIDRFGRPELEGGDE